jgi:small subunit ribosomal protein S14
LAKKAMIIKEEIRAELVLKGKYPKLDCTTVAVFAEDKSFHRDFGLCRVHLREMAHKGLLPGVTKFSW